MFLVCFSSHIRLRIVFRTNRLEVLRCDSARLHFEIGQVAARLQELQRLIAVLLAFYFILLASEKKKNNVRDYFKVIEGPKKHLENQN